MKTETQTAETIADQSASALSTDHNEYNFLTAHSAATDIKSPLEENLAKTPDFVGYTTGTIKMTVSPLLMEQLAELRTMVVTTNLKKLANFIQALQVDLPQADGRLTVILNPAVFCTYVPYCETPQDITDMMREKSEVKIEIFDGFATVDGLPIWERLSGERMDFYSIFKIYRDMKYGLLDSGDYVMQNRTIAGLGRQLNVSGSLLATLAKIYNWSVRCDYYDFYMGREIAKRKAQQVQLVQSDHFKLANKLMKQASDYLEKHVAALKPKDALEMLELGLRYSRISIGLSADKPDAATTAAHQPALAIYNTTTNNTADQMLNLNATLGSNNQNCGSPVERQLQQDMKNEDNLLSILHVLQKSGAMATAIGDNIKASNSVEETDNTSPVVVVDAVSINSSTAADKVGDLND